MQRTDRFITSPLYRQGLIQEGCPVYVHCSRICTDRRSADRFLQLRLVNRRDTEIRDVILSIDGFDAWGAPSGQIAGLILPDCNAKPHSIFGEERLIALGKLRAARLEITVEQVSFADGMVWRCRAAASPRPIEETDWLLCACGLPNSPEQACCDLCFRPLQKASSGDTLDLPELPVLPEEAAEPEPLPLAVAEAAAFRPEPILRSEQELQESYSAFVLAAEEYEAEEEEDGVPRWLFVLLCVVGGIALLAALAFLFYFLKNTKLL